MEIDLQKLPTSGVSALLKPEYLEVYKSHSSISENKPHVLSVLEALEFAFSNSNFHSLPVDSNGIVDATYLLGLSYFKNINATLADLHQACEVCSAFEISNGVGMRRLAIWEPREASISFNNIPSLRVEFVDNVKYSSALEFKVFIQDLVGQIPDCSDFKNGYVVSFYAWEQAVKLLAIEKFNFEGFPLKIYPFGDSSQPVPKHVKVLGRKSVNSSELLGYHVNRVVKVGPFSASIMQNTLSCIQAELQTSAAKWAPISYSVTKLDHDFAHFVFKADVAREISAMIRQQGGLEMFGEKIPVCSLAGNEEHLFYLVKQEKEKRGTKVSAPRNALHTTKSSKSFKKKGKISQKAKVTKMKVNDLASLLKQL